MSITEYICGRRGGSVLCPTHGTIDGRWAERIHVSTAGAQVARRVSMSVGGHRRIGMMGKARGSVCCLGVREWFILALAVTALVAHSEATTSKSHFAKTSKKPKISSAVSPSPSASRSSDAVFNLKTLGASGNGVSDDTQFLLAAWEKACYAGGTATIMVPAGYSFVIASATFFSGQGCSSASMILQVNGNLLGPGDKSKWKTGGASAAWIQFQDCKGFTIQGSGTMDARGQSFWASGGGPIGVRFLRFTNVAVTGITMKNSPQVMLKFNDGQGAVVSGITILNAATSPNTDGIHLQTNVYNVEILNCVIKTGDDCISIGTTVFNVIIKGILCGPGHGISIGSLGNGGLLACVSDIDISEVTFVGTLAGCRIKTCAGGSGKAARISFRDITVQNVPNPVIIDQYYCGKGVKAKNVILDTISFTNVQGTTTQSKNPPVYLNCASPGCTNIRLQNIEITNGHTAYCAYSYGTYGGQMQPPGCLQYKLSSQSRSAPGCGA